LVWSEAGIFEILDFKWLDGNAVALKDPNTAVIAESIANKFFGDHKNAIGRTIQLYSFRIPLQIVGVLKILPGNTDIPIRIAASYPTLRGRLPDVFANNENSWGFTFGQCFLLLKEGQSGEHLAGAVSCFYEKILS
jgi:hypothetical protein